MAMLAALVKPEMGVDQVSEGVAAPPGDPDDDDAEGGAKRFKYGALACEDCNSKVRPCNTAAHTEIAAGYGFARGVSSRGRGVEGAH